VESLTPERQVSVITWYLRKVADNEDTSGFFTSAPGLYLLEKWTHVDSASLKKFYQKVSGQPKALTGRGDFWSNYTEIRILK